jgi:hypothetical protein
LRTRADQLVHALAYALRGIKAQGRAGTLAEEDRYAIAQLVVDKLRESGDPWHLDAELPPFFHGPPTQGYR